MHKAIKKIFILCWYLIASIIILMAVLGVSLRSLTPLLNKHKDYIEQQATHLLHMEVHIERVQADWARFGPEFHFYGVTLSEQHQTAVKVNELVAHVGIFETLWQRSLYFRNIAIVGSDINIRETAPEQYLLNNVLLINLADQTSSAGLVFFRWMITQNHFRLTHIHTTLQLSSGAIDAKLEQVNLYQTKKGMSAFLEGNLSGKMTRAGRTRIFKTEVMLSAWMGIVKQKLTFAEIELLNHDLVLQDGKIVRHYPSLEGVFLWQPVGDNWLLQAKEVTLSKTQLKNEASDTEPKKSSDLSFELWQLTDHYAAHINVLNLSDIGIFSDFFNLTPSMINLADAKIQGALEDIDMIIPNDLSAHNQYQFSGILHEVSSAAYKELPEIHHLNGAISGSISNGSFVVFDNNDSVYFAQYFDRPIAEKQVTANGQWHFADNQLSLLFNSMHVVSPELEASGQMALDIPFNPTSPTLLSLLIEYHLKQSQMAVNFIPMKLLNSDFDQWLTSAMGPGLGSDGKILIHGNMHDFPYPKKNGTFIVDGSIKPVAVSFSSDWPIIKNVSGSLWLHNQLFKADVVGKTENIKLTQAQVLVKDYSGLNPTVLVDLQAKGEASDYLKFIRVSPLNATIGESLKPFDLTGMGQLSLHLELPIEHLDTDHISVAGQWLAQGARFFWKEMNLGFENIKGAIGFTQNSLTAKNIAATLEHQPITININSKQEKNSITELDFNAAGVLTVDQLATIFKIDWLSFYLTGNTHYRAHLQVPVTKAPIYSFSFDTNAKGMQIDLPENLGKTTNSSTPILLQGTINPAQDVVQLTLDYQKDIKAMMHMQKYSQMKANKSTIQVDAQIANFVWPVTIPLPKTSVSSTSLLWQSITALKININHLVLYKNDFSKFLLTGTRQTTGFTWNIDANEAQGNVVVPNDLTQSIKADFNYLTLRNSAPVASKTTASSANSDMAAKTAATWPAFFIDIQHLTLGKHELGTVMAQTMPASNGILFKEININNQLYHLKTQGRWINEGAKDTTYLDGIFTTKNVGDFLSAYDITKHFQAKEGKVNFNVRWLGSPMNFQLNTLEGDTDIDIKDGVIPLDGDAAKMGLGKVLSLFSAQSIQRRLQLNFSDLGDNGYSFNTLISTLHFQTGNAKVQKGLFDGPAAKIGFTGRIGLVRQDYDLYLVVTPYVTSTLPLLATLAGGPIAGVATYAIDKIASSSIDKLTSYKYLLLGPWSKPKLISLDLEKEKKPEEKNIAPVQEAKAS